MGLDLVELVMDVEKTFGISLPDAELAKSTTVGQLYDCIVEILGRENGNIGLADNVLDQLRHVMQSVQGTNQEQVQPNTPLDELIPVCGRRRTWKKLEKSLDVPLPPLHRPAPVKIALTVAAIALGWLTSLGMVGAWELRQAAAVVTVPGAWLMFVTFAILWGLVGCRLTRLMALNWPCDLRTVGDLVQAVVARKFGAVVKQQEQWNHEEVWGILQQRVADVLGVDIQTVTREARFVEDLGAS